MKKIKAPLAIRLLVKKKGISLLKSLLDLNYKLASPYTP